MQLLGNIPHSLRHNDVEVEDLVLIAVESAHQAQDAVREARQMAGMMRRGGECIWSLSMSHSGDVRTG